MGVRGEETRNLNGRKGTEREAKESKAEETQGRNISERSGKEKGGDDAEGNGGGCPSLPQRFCFAFFGRCIRLGSSLLVL